MDGSKEPLEIRPVLIVPPALLNLRSESLSIFWGKKSTKKGRMV